MPLMKRFQKGQKGQTRTILNQFAKEVLHFSSQYGLDGNVSYVVPNLAGPATIYPRYGDMTAACVFRTYGPWWKQTPSSQRSIGFRGNKPYMGQDFVDLIYDQAVYPSEVRIYETYHPGSVVEIYACELQNVNSSPDGKCSSRWHCLWSGNPQVSLCDPRIFSPPLRTVKFATRLLRLVFHHKHLRYYTELDAVELVGSLQDDGTDLDEAYVAHMQKLSISSVDDTSLMDVASGNGCFDMLPGEVIQLIFSYLDLPNLCQSSRTCKLFKKHCYDSLLYAEIDLQPYWSKVSDDMLDGLVQRCQSLLKLSLAWCGRGKVDCTGSLGADSLASFILQCGAELRCLRLSACDFLTGDSIKVIAANCPHLEEVDLSSVVILDSNDLQPLALLHNLTRLDLYRSRITEETASNIIRASPKLEHLNLGAIKTIQSFDNVMSALSQCKFLQSVNLWRAKTLTYEGLSALANGCPELLEIDLGWCSELRGGNFHPCLARFIGSCPKLRKLFLTAVRSVQDADLCVIANYLTDLEQLDVLGTLSVTAGGLQRVFESCRKLRFIDLSFCNNVSEEDVIRMRSAYPRVTVQRSFVSSS